MADAPFTFRMQDDDGNPARGTTSGTASDVESALQGAWIMSRHHEWLVSVFDHRDDPTGVKIAEVGVRWIEQEDDADPSGPSAEQERAWDEQYDGTSLGR